MENQNAIRITSIRNLLVSLLLFLGIGAIFGGAVFIISPSGKLFGMPLTMLQASPFHNFLIPGIILFLALGVLPLTLAIVLVKKPANKFAEKLNIYNDMYWGWTFSIYTAFALIVWIQTEMIFLHAIHWSHSLYMLLAIAILLVALLPPVRNLYKKIIGKL